MISLEHVQRLETRVAKAIEYVQRVTAENTALNEEKTGLQAKLEANQKRLDELELLVMRFKEDQSRIEDGIMAALNRLSQFEEAFENSLKETGSDRKTSRLADKQVHDENKARPLSAAHSNSEIFFEIETPEASPSADDVNTNTGKSQADGDSASAGELDIF